jgi:hypothetical protein
VACFQFVGPDAQLSAGVAACGLRTPFPDARTHGFISHDFLRTEAMPMLELATDGHQEGADAMATLIWRSPPDHLVEPRHDSSAERERRQPFSMLPRSTVACL